MVALHAHDPVRALEVDAGDGLGLWIAFDSDRHLKFQCQPGGQELQRQVVGLAGHPDRADGQVGRLLHHGGQLCPPDGDPGP